MIKALVIVASAMLLTSCAPLLVGGLIGGVLVYEHQHTRWCYAPNGVVFRCHPHPRHFVWHR